MKPASILFVTGFVLVISSFAQTQQTSAGELELGIQAYKNARYEDAIRHLQTATELGPNNVSAHFYMALACANQYLPGTHEGPDNLLMAEQAIDHYQHVLNSDADRQQKLDSAKGIAYLYFNQKKLEDAKTYNQIAAGLVPKDPEPYYFIGVIDWTQCYVPRMEERARLGVKPEELLNPRNKAQRKACDELRATSMPTIEEGIDNLEKAIDLRPDYDDAMAYLNLMHREKADLECDDLAARASDLRSADVWVDKNLAVRKRRASGAAMPAPSNPQSNIRLDPR